VGDSRALKDKIVHFFVVFSFIFGLSFFLGCAYFIICCAFYSSSHEKEVKLIFGFWCGNPSQCLCNAGIFSFYLFVLFCGRCCEMSLLE